MLSRDLEFESRSVKSRGATAREAGWRARLLRMPLYWKLLLAHVGVVTLAVLAALWLATRFDPTHPAWLTVSIAILAGIALSTTLAALVLRLALTPLRDLERAARDALDGGETARLTVHPVADEELRDVVTLLNALLERASEHRQQLRELTARALGSAESERRRVGLLLQDEIAQRLASVLVQLRLLASADGRAERERAGEAVREQIVSALEEVRGMARTLRPPELEELGLDRAVRALVREIREEGGCEVDAEIEPVSRALSHPAALAVFRILQESLLAARGAEPPCRLDLRLYRDGSDVVTEVVADTTTPVLEAWLEERPGSPSGIGLLGMRERARFVGGSVAVERGRDGRTRMRARIPIEER